MKIFYNTFLNFSCLKKKRLTFLLNKMDNHVISEFFKTITNAITTTIDRYEKSSPFDNNGNNVQNVSEENKNESLFVLDDYTVNETIYKNTHLCILRLENKQSQKYPRIVVKQFININGRDKIYEKYFNEEYNILKKIEKFGNEDFFIKPLGFKNEEFKVQKIITTTSSIIIEEGICALSDINVLRCKQGKYYKETELFYLLDFLLKAFALLETKNYVHCDIKPQNILIFKKDQEGKNIYHYKIADFGTSLFLPHDNYIQFKYLKGCTKPYASPELLGNSDNENVIDPFKSDVYSLGILMMELMGVFNRKKIKKYIKHKIFPSRIKDNYPLLSPFILKMLEVDVNQRDRFVNLNSILEDLIRTNSIHPTQPNEQDFERMRNKDKNNVLKFVPSLEKRVQREESQTLYIREDCVFLNQQQKVNDNSMHEINEAWREALKKMINRPFFANILTLFGNDKNEFLRIIFEIDDLTKEAIILYENENYNAAKILMEEAISLCQEKMSWVFTGWHCASFLIQINRHLREFNEIEKLILKQNYLQEDDEYLKLIFGSNTKNSSLLSLDEMLKLPLLFNFVDQQNDLSPFVKEIYKLAPFQKFSFFKKLTAFQNMDSNHLLMDRRQLMMKL